MAKLKGLSLTIAIATVIAISCLAARSAPAQNVKTQAPAAKLSDKAVDEQIKASKTFRAAVAVGQIPADQVPARWRQELSRIERIIEAIKDQQPAHPQLEEMLGLRKVAQFMVSEELRLRTLEVQLIAEEHVLIAMKSGKPSYAEQMAILKMKRADNQVLRGNDAQALKLLEEALESAQASSYAGHAEEGVIHMRLAGVHCRAQHWAKSAEHARKAVNIFTPLSAQPNFNNTEQLLTALWYAAISNSCLGVDNEAQKDITAFLALAGKGTTPLREADIYKQVLGMRSSLAAKNSSLFIPVRQRYALLLNGRNLIAEEEAELAEVKRLQSLPKPKQ